MAMLGINVDFKNKSYFSFMQDCEKISRLNPGQFLVWLGSKPKIETEFNRISEQYFRSCFIHKTDEYATTSLKWTRQLRNIVWFQKTISDEDVDILKKVKHVFEQVSFEYTTDMFKIACNDDKDKLKIFTDASDKYKKAIEILEQLILTFDKNRTDKCGIDSSEKGCKRPQNISVRRDLEAMEKDEVTELMRGFGGGPIHTSSAPQPTHNLYRTTAARNLGNLLDLLRKDEEGK